MCLNFLGEENSLCEVEFFGRFCLEEGTRLVLCVVHSTVTCYQIGGLEVSF